MRNKLNGIWIAVFCLGTLSACSDVPDCADADYTETAVELAKENNFLIAETLGMLAIGTQVQIQNDIGELKRDDDILNSFSDGNDELRELENEQNNLYSQCREMFKNENKWCRKLVCRGTYNSDFDVQRIRRECPHVGEWVRENTQPIVEKKIEAEARVKQLRKLARERQEEISQDVREDYDSRMEKAWRDAKFTISNIVTTLENKDSGSVECAADLVVDVEDISAEKRIAYKLETTSDDEVYVTLFQ